MPVGESVVEAILALVRSARPGHGNDLTDKQRRLGSGSARGSIADAVRPAPVRFMKGGLLHRLMTSTRLPKPVLQHRMALTFAARAEGMTVRDPSLPA